MRLLVTAVFAVLVLALPAGTFSASRYDRDAFHHWIDADSDGFDTRQEILMDQSVYDARAGYTALVLNEYRVIAGTWICPYTGMVLHDPADLDIDHIVPLEWAWRHGAEGWDSETRERFANDPDNLLAVLDRVNQAKGSKGPDEWMPPARTMHGQYLQRFNAVCDKYGLRNEDIQRSH